MTWDGPNDEWTPADDALKLFLDRASLIPLRKLLNETKDPSPMVHDPYVAGYNAAQSQFLKRLRLIEQAYDTFDRYEARLSSV